MLKHSFYLKNKICDGNKTGNNKSRTESSSSIENGFGSLPDTNMAPCCSTDQRCSNISLRSESLQKISSKRSSSKVLRLQYSGASQASLSESARFSMRIFCKQQHILGEEVATSRDAIPSSPISINHSITSINHSSPWDKPKYYYQNILCRILFKYWKVLVGFLVGLILTLAIALAVKPQVGCGKGMLRCSSKVF